MNAGDTDAAIAAGEAAIARAVETLLARAIAWLPALAQSRLAAGATWRIGRRPIPADGHSILGPIRAVPGLFVAVTHSGVTLAAHIGALLAEELASGHMPAELTLFRPARFGI